MCHFKKNTICIYLSIIVTATFSCVTDSEDPELARIEAALVSTKDDPVRSSLVYEEVKTRDAAGKSFDKIDVFGALTPDQVQRIARPYRHLSPSEDWVYDEDAWSSVDENGNVEKGYRITRRANDNPYMPIPDTRPARLNEELKRQLVSRSDAVFRVLIQVRDFPEWDIPILAREGLTSVAAYRHL